MYIYIYLSQNKCQILNDIAIIVRGYHVRKEKKGLLPYGQLWGGGRAEEPVGNRGGVYPNKSVKIRAFALLRGSFKSKGLS